MKAKTEQLLNLLLWSAEQLTRPSFRNLTDSYESWAYRKGLLRQVATLERQRLVERKQEASGDRVYRLTGEGRLRALGGRDLRARWTRAWDGNWRVVLYDLPLAHNAQRARLRRYLSGNGFGYLQNSVWITPDPLEEEINLLRGGEINPETLILLTAQPCAGESNADIVAGAWDFPKINRRYQQHLKILAQKPASKALSKAQTGSLLRWAAAEHASWIKAVGLDPLLPERLLPDDYQGKRVWQKRVEVLRSAHRQLEGAAI